MIRVLFFLGWLLTALDLIWAAVIYFGRDGGDAATRGLGKGLGTMMAVIAVVAAALLLWGGREAGRPLAVILGTLVAAAPLMLTVVMMGSRQGLGLIYQSLREPKREYQPSPQYAYPDAASREAALELVRNDYAKLEALLKASPAPDLTARDERGVTLLGLAVRVAIMDGGRVEEADGVRLLLAAGARPREDALEPEERLLEAVVSGRTEASRIALELLLDAGLSPDARMKDGRPVLFHPRLRPEAARVLLRHGVKRDVPDNRGGAGDWSAVTYQADLRNWETALVLLEGGVPQDHGTPPGSVLARVLRNIDAGLMPSDKANAAYQAFLAAAKP
ncbi:MAG: hypothetical protein U0R19_36725 [Bryobacteraceae bacterium]